MNASQILVSLTSLMFALGCGGEASLGDMDGGSTSSSTSGATTGSGTGSTSATGSTSGSTSGGSTAATTGGMTGGTTAATTGGTGGTSGSTATTGGTGGKLTTSGGGAGGKSTTTGGGAGGASGGSGGAATDGGEPLCNIKCTPGTHCVIETIQCFAPPCPGTGIAHCVPDVRVMCGGIAAIKCPGAGTCIDDPTDMCDPKMGGTDCSGICECAATKCAAGSHFDMSPAACTCVPD